MLGLLTDVVRESQRAPAMAFGFILVAITVVIFATSFPATEPWLVSFSLGLMRAAEAVPLVSLEPYLSYEGTGSARFSIDGLGEHQGRGRFLEDVVLPFYAWFTGALVAMRWIFRIPTGNGHFWLRYWRVLLLCGACLAGYVASAMSRPDVASIGGLYLALVGVVLVTGAWAAWVGALVDALETRLGLYASTGEGLATSSST